MISASGDVLERLEQRFGKKPVTLLLVLIALAIAGYCVSVIWSSIVQPFVPLVVNLWNGNASTIETVMSAISKVAMLALWIFGTTIVMNAIDILKAKRLADEVRDRAEEVRESIDATLAALKKDSDHIGRQLERSEKLMDMIVNFTQALESTAETTKNPKLKKDILALVRRLKEGM